MAEVSNQSDLVSSSSDASPGDHRSTLLLVDDDELSRVALRRRLSRLRVRILEAEDGQQALELARRERPSVILSDWMMPCLDGPSLCEAIRRDASFRSCYLILLTSHDRPEQVAEGLRRGADDYVKRSAAPDEILARVKAGFRTSALVRELEQTHKALGRSYELLAEKQGQLEEELRSAARFIDSLLPAPGEPMAGIALAWEYLPSLALGGDLFDAAPCDADTLGCYILDASGHGVSAALRAASMASLLRPESFFQYAHGYDPGRVLTELNQRFPLSEDGNYFTVWMGTVGVSSNELRFASAGHAGALIQREDGRIEPASRPSLPLGFMPEERYETISVALHRKDRLLLFSDGVYEASCPEGQRWGQEGLRRAVDGQAGTALPDLLRRVVGEARSWQREEAFRDDVALVGLELR